VTFAGEVRHPLDPDPARSSKASAILGLGVLAVVTGPVIGGVIPAALALLMARETRRDLVAADGFLLGTRRMRNGIRLAWAGIVLAIASLIAVTIMGLLHYARSRGTDFAPTVN
jgi:(hydroxyamino)benzene mutase